MRPAPAQAVTIWSNVNGSRPVAVSTTAHPHSPRSGSGMPTTAAFATCGHPHSTSSISLAEYFPLANDDVLQPSSEHHMTVGASHGQITGAESPLGVDRLDIEQRIGVALERDRPSDPHLARRGRRLIRRPSRSTCCSPPPGRPPRGRVGRRCRRQFPGRSSVIR